MTTQGSSTGPGPGPNMRPALNPERRPQRLFSKIHVAMKIAGQRLNDKRYTGIGKWLDEDALSRFRTTVRQHIRAELDATIDTWPQGVVHDYRPEVRRAKLRAMNDNWSLFEIGPICPVQGDDLQTDDEFVPSDLIYSPFYEE